jgi:hypothetical protein
MIGVQETLSFLHRNGDGLLRGQEGTICGHIKQKLYLCAVQCTGELQMPNDNNCAKSMEREHAVSSIVTRFPLFLGA